MQAHNTHFKNILIGAALVSLSVSCAKAQVYFEDSFSTTDGGSYDVNDQIGSPRQSGSLVEPGGVSYSEYNPSDDYRTQVNNGNNPGLLIDANGNSGNAESLYESPNIDLPTVSTTISFGLVLPAALSRADGFSFVDFGSSAQNQFVNSLNGGGMGILFGSDGSYQVFDQSINDGTGNALLVGSGTSSQLLANVTAGTAASISITMDPFSGVSLTIDGVQQDINGASTGDDYFRFFGDNYVTLGQANFNSNSGGVPTYFTDLTVSAEATPAVPEPSTWALTFLGCAGLFYVVRRRKSDYSA